MLQNLRAYFIFYAITIKWIMCVQEKVSFLLCHKTKVELKQNFRRSLLIYKYKCTIKIAKHMPGMAKSWYPVAQG